MDLSKLSNEELLALRKAPAQQPTSDLSKLSDEQLLALRKPSYGADIAETVLPSAIRAVTNIGGALGNVDTMARSGANWIAQKLTGRSDQMVPPQSAYPTTERLNQGVEQAVGTPLYQPKTIPGKIVGRSIEYAPAALGGPDTLAAAVGATAVPAAAGVLAGEGAKALGAPEGVQKGADIFASLLAPYAYNKMVNGIMTMHARETQVPSTTQRKSITDATYKLGNMAEASIPSDKVGSFLTDVSGQVSQSAHDIRGYNKPVANILGLMDDAATKGEPITIEQVHKWREILSKDIGKPSDNGGLAKWLYGQLTDFMYTPENYVGNGKQAVDLYKAGDESFKLFKNSQLMDQYWRQSQNKLANYSQAGFATGVRQKFRSLADRMAVEGSQADRFYGPELQDAAERVARGTPGMNALRAASKFAPLTLKGLASIGGAGLAGGPVAAGIATGAGTLGKLGFELGTLNEARRASDLFRLGHELNVPGLLSYPGILGGLVGSRATQRR